MKAILFFALFLNHAVARDYDDKLEFEIRKQENINFHDKTAKQLLAIHEKQLKRLETCKTNICFRVVMNEKNALLDTLISEITLNFLRKTNQFMKNCIDCKGEKK